MNDVLNDIVEHFKIPELELDKRTCRKLSVREGGNEELWEPKKMEPYICKVIFEGNRVFVFRYF